MLASQRVPGYNLSHSIPHPSDHGSFTNNEYLYDANGNMVRDMNKQISHIDYSVHNLPEHIQFSKANQENILFPNWRTSSEACPDFIIKFSSSHQSYISFRWNRLKLFSKRRFPGVFTFENKAFTEPQFYTE